MRKIGIPILLLLTAVMIIGSCSKEVRGHTDDAPALQPLSQDINAGTWKTILIAAPNAVAVAAPVAVNSPEYIAQVNEIRSTQAQLTPLEIDQVKYWSAGAVLRWNEILRELVAKYNLPPYQNADGTYPVPSAANPLAYPLFPFANPPYAARAYAYFSAAQYDALVAAWHYKKLYNRPAPYVNFADIKTLVPKSDLPSYPSEDAVVAGTAMEMLKLLFPGEQEFIQRKAAEHKLARIISGANVRSDLDAGEALGRAIALQFVARARTDRAGSAVGTPADWQAISDAVVARGERPWVSLESPRRPPMLPLFGRVKPFLFDSATVVALRPGPPPGVNSPQMQTELAEVLDMIQHPTRERTRIVHYWADGVGTYTPPGHWNAIAAEDFIPKQFSEVRWARNMALLNMSLMDAAIVCWDTKNYYSNPRPTQLNANIKTLTGIPNFPAYISGHSTFSGAAATILAYVIPQNADKYNAMAKEASMSRLYGGIHYRSDCEVGLQVGASVGNHAVTRARTDGADN